MLLRISALTLLAAIAGAASGCDCPFGGEPTRSAYVYCKPATGGAKVAGPAAFPLYRTNAGYSDGATCLHDDGTCTEHPKFGMTTFYGDGKYEVNLDVELLAGTGAGSYLLPDPVIRTQGSLVPATISGSVPLGVISGELIVERSDPGSFRASYAMELSTPTADRFSVTDGVVEVSCSLKAIDGCTGDPIDIP